LRVAKEFEFLRPEAQGGSSASSRASKAREPQAPHHHGLVHSGLVTQIGICQ
jgi:hypothetical protein